MKAIYILTLVVSCTFSTLLNAQDVLQLNSAQQNGGTVKGCTGIVLKPGFSFTSSAGKSLSLVIDNSVCSPKSEIMAIPQNQNYILTITPTSPISSVNYNKSNNQLAIDRSQDVNAGVLVNIQYFDGLGRPVQTVQRGITPNKADLVNLQEYDRFGRDSTAWLPMTSSSNGAFVDPSALKNGILASSLYNGDKNPFSKPVYEASPLNRVLQQFAPGEDWQTKGKAVKADYLANVSGDKNLNCVLYNVGGTTQSPTLSKKGNYPSSELYVTQTTDENGNVSYEFKDKLDQVVLTRQINNEDSYDTYYVYDDFGNLCFVLPPLIQNEGISQAKLDELAYQYQYDARNRCVWKKLPGCEHINYVYDKADQLIYTQDGEQRDRKEWLFSISDAFGSPVLSGVTMEPIKEISNKVIKAEYTGISTNQGYQIKGNNADITFPIQSLLSVNYYDNYKFLGKHGFLNQIYDSTKESQGYGKRYNEGDYAAKGQLTGSIIALFGHDVASNSFLHTTMYYDNRGRVVQTHSSNHLGGNEIECLAYNFTGQPIKTLHIHDDNKKTKVQEEYAYNYDHAGRLKETTYSIDKATPIILSMNEYDELGRLKSVKRANNVKLQNNYTYNIRSWTKSIISPLFAQELYYNESNGSNTPSYNGNISRTKWKHGTDAEKSYNFTYDALSQLKEADYKGGEKVDYGANYTYDMHGNMLTLERKGKTDNGYGAVDKLSMVYNGNQLVNIIDKGDNVKLTQSSDFKDYSNGKGVYEYNANGAMVKDTHKGISKIEYNSLNLPVSIAIDNGQGIKGSVQYLYSATGVKLQTIHKTDGAAQRTPMAGAVAFETEVTEDETTDYVGNKIYKKGKLVKILVDGGYYDVEKEKYYFYIQDHLGNNRVVADAQGTVVQKSDYYPFGMEFADNTEPDKQPYKYNGKELDKQHGLNMYDYSARYMEPAIGRFTSVDPLAEKYYSISPYAYVGNNPINAIDINGDSITITYRTGFLGLGGKNTLLYENGNLYNKDGSAYTGKVKGFVSKVVNALGDLNNTSEGSSIVSELQASTNVFDIQKAGKNSFEDNNRSKAVGNLVVPGSSTGSGGTVYWNPNGTDGGLDIKGNTARPSYVGLGHELAHGSDSNRGVLDFNKTEKIANAEWNAVYRENLIRSQAGVTLRQYYGIDMTTGSSVGIGPNLFKYYLNKQMKNYYKSLIP